MKRFQPGFGAENDWQPVLSLCIREYIIIKYLVLAMSALGTQKSPGRGPPPEIAFYFSADPLRHRLHRQVYRRKKEKKKKLRSRRTTGWRKPSQRLKTKSNLHVRTYGGWSTCSPQPVCRFLNKETAISSLRNRTSFRQSPTPLLAPIRSRDDR